MKSVDDDEESGSSEDRNSAASPAPLSEEEAAELVVDQDREVQANPSLRVRQAEPKISKEKIV